MNIYKSRNVKTPERGTDKSAGIDIFIPESEDLTYSLFSEVRDRLPNPKNKISLYPGESVLIPIGIHVNVPENHALIAFNKSGVAAKRNLVIGACVIDEDYMGEVHVDIKNVGNTIQDLCPGDKITQLLCVPINYTSINICDTLEECYGNKESERGTGGFGSTGDK